jgi:hypothetical protein
VFIRYYEPENKVVYVVDGSSILVGAFEEGYESYAGFESVDTKVYSEAIIYTEETLYPELLTGETALVDIPETYVEPVVRVEAVSVATVTMVQPIVSETTITVTSVVQRIDIETVAVSAVLVAVVAILVIGIYIVFKKTR